MTQIESEVYGTGVTHSLTHFCHQILFIWHNFLALICQVLKEKSRWILEMSSMRRNNPEKRLRDIPGPFSWPFFGTTLSRAIGTDLNASSQTLVEKYGTIIKLEHYWNYPLILVYDPDDIEKVLKNASNFRPEMEIVASHRRRRPDRYDTVGIVNSQGEDWKKLRTSLSTIHNHSYILSYVPSCDEIMTDFIQVIRDLRTSRVQNFDDMILRLTLEISSKLILNKRLNLLDSRKSQRMDVFLHASHQYFKALQVSMYGFPVWKYFPSKVWTQFVKYEDKMHDIFTEVVEEEIRNGSVSGLLKTILEMEQLSMKDRQTLVRDVILASMEPIQNSTIIVLYWISRHPEVEWKLFKELKEILPEKNSKFDENCLGNVPYLKACVQEAFRMMPTTPNLARFTETEIKLQNYEIPPYTLIVCQHWFACLQESNFYRAKEFIPERWLIDRKVFETSDQFQPHRPRLLYHFGFGRRECPGRRFAFQEICITVAKLLRNFKIVFPEDLKVNYYFLQQPSFPVSIDIRERPED